MKHQLLQAQVGLRNLDKPTEQVLESVKADIALFAQGSITHQGKYDIVDALEGITEVLLRLVAAHSRV